MQFFFFFNFLQSPTVYFFCSTTISIIFITHGPTFKTYHTPMTWRSSESLWGSSHEISLNQFLTSLFPLASQDSSAYRINLVTSLARNISAPETRMTDF